MVARERRRRLKILTWHVHGNYLYYLTQVPHDFYLVTDALRTAHHSGRSGSLPWGSNVHEVRVEEIRYNGFDAVLYQSRDAWDVDRERWLSAEQRRLPSLYIEHDPPQEHPTDTRHWAGEHDTTLVHVTPYNALMWDNGAARVRVIDHGVKPLADARYSGELMRGIVVVNNMAQRGRRLGRDLFEDVSKVVPLELVGMDAERLGGAGEVGHLELPAFVARHRFFFHPIRYTSLGLALIEAMMAGVPVVGLATTELVTVIRNGENGIIDTQVDKLVDAMRRMLHDPEYARSLGEAGRRTALERFGIDRFVDDWMRVLSEATH
jgi:hypothetical protein